MQYKNAKIAYVLKIFYATFAFLVFIIAMHGVKSLIASNIEVVFSKKEPDLKGGKRKWSGVTISPPLGLDRYSFQKRDYMRGRSFPNPHLATGKKGILIFLE